MHEISKLARTIFENLVLEERETDDQLVSQLCNNDTALIDEVKELLKAYRAADSLMDAPLGDKRLKGFQSSVEVGSRLGPYTLVRLVGDGGFGQVFEAEQLVPIQRTVAIKLIKPGMDSEEVLRRFDNERQALAVLDHPNIAKVLEAGVTDQGRPYFVMDLVTGTEIVAFCDEDHLTVSERLELFIDICRGLQHAHQKGIIHRDLKPANVLVEISNGRPNPKIIDFGIAKAIDCNYSLASDITRPLSLLGTPLYMSPEQARQSRDVDTRSDIYSLGVILYELLTGTTPLSNDVLKEAGSDEIHELIQNSTLPKPSSRIEDGAHLAQLALQRNTSSGNLLRTVRGDLDWITMKALDQDRERRYSTADEFADDIRHWLKHEAIIARPPSRLYKIRKLVRQHQIAFSVATSIILILMVATIFSVWQVRLANLAKMEQQALRLVAEGQIDFLFNYVDGTIGSADPRYSGQNVRLVDCYDLLFGKLDSQFANDPETRAQMYFKLGMGYEKLGFIKKAKHSLEMSLRIRKELGQTDDQQSLSNYSLLAIVYARDGEYEKARSMANTGLKIAGLGDMNESGDSKNKLNSVIECKMALNLVAYGREDFLGAIRFAKEAHQLAEKSGSRHYKTGALLDISSSYARLYNIDMATKFAKEACSVAAEAFGDEHYDSILASRNLASIYVLSGQNLKAIEIFERVIPRMKQILIDNHFRITESLTLLARARRQSGDNKSAWLALDEAKKAIESSTVVRANTRRSFLTCKASCLVADRKFEESEKIQTRLLDDSISLYGADSVQASEDRYNLALTCMRLGKPEKANELANSVYNHRVTRYGASHNRTIVSQTGLCSILYKTGEPDKAITLMEEALVTLKKKSSPERSLVNSYKWMLGIALVEHRPEQTEQGIACFDEVIEEVESNQSRGNLAIKLRQAGFVCFKTRLFDDAERYLLHAIKVDESGKADSLLGQVMLGRLPESKSEMTAPEQFAAIEQHLVAGYDKLKQQNAPTVTPRMTQTASALIELYQRSGEDEKRRKWEAKLQK